MIPRGALVVSCEARRDSLVHGPTPMSLMARAVAQGGAAAIRADGLMDVAAIVATVRLPVIGLCTRAVPGFDVTITPDFNAAWRVAEAGADIIALDATARPRPGEDAATLIRRIRDELGHAVLADIATLEEGLRAAEWGADYLATTLSGRTGGDEPEAPDFNLVAALAHQCGVPVVASGRFRTPDQVAHAFALGAHAVCVGAAITDPRAITSRFVDASPR